jgi:hypothetical protein
MRRVVFKARFLGLVLLAMVAGAWPMAAQAAVPAGTAPRLGTALNFAVLGASTVTSTGPTVITGDLGVSPGAAVTGSPTVHGTLHLGDPVAAQAQKDLAIAFADAAAAAPTANLTGHVLGQTTFQTLIPGVYKFDSEAQLTGTLTLSGSGVYIFQIGTKITTASASKVLLTNGAQACAVYWQVGSSATLGTTTSLWAISWPAPQSR